MAKFSLKALVLWFVLGSFTIQGVAEILGRWSLDDLDSGHVIESLNQTSSSTVLIAREGATNTRTGVLNIEDVNYLSFSVPNGDCIVDSSKCGQGFGASFWLRYKGQVISDILGENTAQLGQLIQWLSDVSDPDLRWVNCYRAKEHGWNALMFHQRCDFKGPTLTLVQSHANFIFGGFTEQDWGGSPGFKKSEISFLFTLANGEGRPRGKFPISNVSQAVYNSPSYGPYFGNGDLVIGDRAGENLTSSSRLGSSYTLPSDVVPGSVEAFNLLAGSEFFPIIAMEVFFMECFHPLGMESRKITDNMITSPNSSPKGNNSINAPWQARLNNPPNEIWMPAEHSSPILSVTFAIKYHIMGMEAHGNKDPNKPSYASQLRIDYWATTGGNVNNLGNFFLDDAFENKRFIFKPSFAAVILQISVVGYQMEVALAVEIFGCSIESCTEPLGMQNNTIKDEQISTSSFKPNFLAAHSRAFGPSPDICWKPSSPNNPDDYLQVDLGRVHVLTGVATQAGGNGHWVETYKVRYSIDGVKWNEYVNQTGAMQVFEGIGDGTLARTDLEPVVQARYVRLVPVSGQKCLRLELYGCTAKKAGKSRILSSGNDLDDHTGFKLTSFGQAIYGLYYTQSSYSFSESQFPQTDWSRIVFTGKSSDGAPNIFIDNAMLNSAEIESPVLSVNPATVIQLGSSWSTEQLWSTENIQLSDLTLWRDIPASDVQTWGETTLPDMLDLCNFDGSPCIWKTGNWTIGTDCVPSHDRGTGPCQGASGAGFLYFESSYRAKGDTARFESPYVVSSYKCVQFKYHMWGKRIGRLNVYSRKKDGEGRIAKWRLGGDQGNEWKDGRLRVTRSFAFKIIFEAVAGGGSLGDIAIDEVALSTTLCTSFPPEAVDNVPGFANSEIIGHLSALGDFLMAELESVGEGEKTWVPCYRALSDGRDVAEFHSRCDDKGPTVTIVRVNEEIFGGFNGENWKSSLENGVIVSTRSFLFSLLNSLGEGPYKFDLKPDRRHMAHFVNPNHGPTFGQGDLVLETMWNGASALGSSYKSEPPASSTPFKFAANGSFSISDVEVLYAGDHILCSCGGRLCDSITGECACDQTNRLVEYCWEGNHTAVVDLYQTASSYWPLDSIQKLVDRLRAASGKVHGGVSLDAEGLSGKALRLDGVTGWVDLGDLDDVCIDGGLCTGNLSVSLYLKFYIMESEQYQTFLSLDDGQTESKIYYDNAAKKAFVALNTTELSLWYAFSVATERWIHLGFSWDMNNRFLEVHKLDNPQQPIAISWSVCHACERAPPVTTYVTLGAGSFPNASFDEIGIWFQPLTKDDFLNIYHTYIGPPRLYAELSLLFVNVSWSYDFEDSESDQYVSLLQSVKSEIEAFYSGKADVVLNPDDISLLNCWDDDGLLSCNLSLYYHSSGYGQFRLLLDWLPENTLNNSQVVIIREDNNNVPNTPVPGLSAVATGPSTIEVSWDRPPESEIPGIFTGYILYVGNRSGLNISHTKTSHTVRGLNSFTNYSIKFAVQSYEGEGMAETMYARTDEAAPDRPPNINATATGPVSIQVDWHLPPGHVPGIVRGFRLFYLETEDIYNQTNYDTTDGQSITYYHGYDVDVTNVTLYDTAVLTYEVTGLEIFTEYCMWVTVFTVADSPHSHAVFIRTDEDVPDEAPQNLTITQKTSTECHLRWSPIPPYHHKGVLLGFRLVYSSNESDVTLNITLPPSSPYGPLLELKPSTAYILQVAGFTSKGDGNYSTSITCLTDDDVPSAPPRNIKVDTKTSRSCAVSWHPVPPEHRHGIIIGYELFALTSSGDLLQNVSVDAGTLTYNLSGLDPHMKYNISVVGVTSAGAGIHSNESNTNCRTEADYPSASPIELAVTDTTPESCSISWKGISQEHINGRLLGYVVKTVKTDSAEQSAVEVLGTRVIVCKRLGEATSSELEVFTAYNMTVAVYNNKGRGNYSETLECVTGQKAPSLPPQNITGYNTSTNSIMVHWYPVPESDRNGIVLYYLIRYSSQGIVGDPPSDNIEIAPGNSTSIELVGLDPFANYSIQMAAVTVEQGNYSEAIVVTTGEEAPTTAPNIVEAYNTSARSIFVQWTPPPPPIHGILRGYRIFFKNLNDSTHNATANQTVNASTLSYELTGLEAFSRYRIQVLAFTVSDGPESEPVQVFTAEKPPLLPDVIPEDVAKAQVTSTSCSLTWNSVNNANPDPDYAVHGYYVYYRRAGTNDTLEKVEVVGANNTNSLVPQLEEFVNYEFYIVAFNLYGEGNGSDVLYCHTEEDAPSSPPVNLTGLEITPRSIKVTWDWPPEGDRNGIIRGFRFIYYRKDQGNSSAVIVEVPVVNPSGVRRRRATTPDDSSWSFTDLDEYTTYVFQILAYTVNDSVLSPPVEITTAEDAPSSAPTQLWAVNTSSTSLHVTWYEVPFQDQNGIIRGFLVSLWEKEDQATLTHLNVTEQDARAIVPLRKKRSIGSSFEYELPGLKMWTKYYVMVAAYTVGPGPFTAPFLVRTDEDVPCMPPQYVTYDIPGLSVLLAKWNPVPEHCRNGIILGYTVKYHRLDGISPVKVEIVPDYVLYAFLYDMDIYSNYSIQISAFTSKGDGNATMDLALPDALGPRSTPINVTAENYTTTSSIPVSWKPIDDELILERMLGYRVSYRAVLIGGEKPEEEQPTFNFTLRKSTLEALIEGLDSFTRYQINVSGFSRRGDGPSGITDGDTCRCHKRLSTNYRLFPPYVDQLELTDDVILTVANMTGMLPLILDNLIVTCCETCKAHGRSYVDFKYNGTNGTAKQNSEKDMKYLIDDNNDLSFPVYGWKWQEYYSVYYRYIPLVESPGVAFIIIENEVLSPTQRLINEVVATWPYSIITTLLATLAGIILWFLDTSSNPEQFPQSFFRGAGNGFWWAFISMTTLGYGDKVPSAYISKAFAILWICVGLALMALLSGALTSAITVLVINIDTPLYGTKVAVIQDTPEYRLAVTKNAVLNKDKNYTTFSEVYDALINRDVEGMLMDTFEAGTKASFFEDPRIRVHTIYDYKSTYGIVLAGNSTRLLHCSKGYMQANKDEMYEHIQTFIRTIKEDHLPESVEMASGLFDPETDIFKYFMYISFAVLALAVILGLIWEYRRKVTAQKVAQEESNIDSDKSKELHEEMKNFVAEFYDNFKSNYHRLTNLHRSQLRSLKQAPCEKPGIIDCATNEAYGMAGPKRWSGIMEKHGALLH